MACQQRISQQIKQLQGHVASLKVNVLNKEREVRLIADDNVRLKMERRVDDTEESGVEWAADSKTLVRNKGRLFAVTAQMEQFSDDHAQPLELGEREARIAHLQAKCEAIQAQPVEAKRKLTATTARNARICACTVYV